MPGPVFWVLEPVVADSPLMWANPTGAMACYTGVCRAGVVTVAASAPGVELDLPIDGYGAHGPVGHGGLRAGEKRSQAGQQGHRDADPAGGGQQSGGLAAQQPGQPEPDHAGTSLPSARGARCAAGRRASPIR